MITALFGDRIIFIEQGAVVEDAGDALDPPTRKRLRVMLRREYFTEAPDPTEEAKPGPDGELVIGEGFRALEPGSDEHSIAAALEAGADSAFAI